LTLYILHISTFILVLDILILIILCICTSPHTV